MSEIESKIMEVLNTIEYGFKDDKGINLINDDEKWKYEFYNFYYLLSPDELLDKKCGVCWDQVELERKLFHENNINVSTYFIYIDDKKNLPSHTFLIYENEEHKYCWFEHSWYDYKGIHKYDSLNELLSDVKIKFVASRKNEIDGEFEVKLYKYDKPNYGINCDEFYQYINGQEIIDI